MFAYADHVLLLNLLQLTDTEVQLFLRPHLCIALLSQLALGPTVVLFELEGYKYDTLVFTVIVIVTDD